MTDFTVTTRTDGPSRWLTAVGDLDFAAVHILVGTVHRLLKEADVTSIEVEISRVPFVDSIGLGALVTVHNAATAAGKRLVLRDPAGQPRRLLESTALDALLMIRDDRTGLVRLAT